MKTPLSSALSTVRKNIKVKILGKIPLASDIENVAFNEMLIPLSAAQ